MKKDWRNVEKTFLEFGIDYQLRDWYYLCKIDNREFYYSPQKDKWRMKGKRVWHKSKDTTDFINQAKVYSPPGRTKSQQSKTNSKSNYSNRNSKQNNNSRKSRENSYKVSETFLARFEYYLIIQRKQGYNTAWIWRSLIDNYELTTTEICFLCVVFDYSPWWAYYKAKEHGVGLSKNEIFRIIDLNQSYWLRCFRNHWGGWSQGSSNSSNSTPPPPPPSPYQYHLQLLQLKFPFTKEELKSAYRRKSLETHPDAGGTAEAFRKVNHAYQVLSKV